MHIPWPAFWSRARIFFEDAGIFCLTFYWLSCINHTRHCISFPTFVYSKYSNRSKTLRKQSNHLQIFTSPPNHFQVLPLYFDRWHFSPLANVFLEFVHGIQISFHRKDSSYLIDLFDFDFHGIITANTTGISTCGNKRACYLEGTEACGLCRLITNQSWVFREHHAFIWWKGECPLCDKSPAWRSITPICPETESLTPTNLPLLVEQLAQGHRVREKK